MAGVSSLTSGLSEYIDRQLQRLVINLPVYLSDSGHLFFLSAEIPWEQDMFLVTLDVAAFYSNIPHEKGLFVINKFLSEDPLMPLNQRQFIVEGLQFILEHNYFIFTINIYYSIEGLRWVPNVHLFSLISIWDCLKRFSFTTILLFFPYIKFY